ncbi:MAG: PAS domain S-box protein, partial [Chloroflexota bacterium]
MPKLQAIGGAEHRPASPAILLFDENGNCTRANDQAARITSTGRDELVGRYISDVLAWDGHEVAEALRRCINADEPEGCCREVSWTASGEVRRGLACLVPLRQGKVMGVTLVLLPVGDSTSQAEIAPEWRELYRSLVEATGLGVVRLNREGRRTFVSDYAAEFVGRSKEEMLRGWFGDAMLPKDRKKALEVMERTFQTGKTVRGFVTQYLVRGQMGHLLLNWSPIRDERGNVVEVHVVGTDVTELVRMQRKLELYSVEVGKAHEAERLNLSRLIHDDSVQSLLGVSRLLGSVMTQHRRELPQAVLGKLEEMRGLLSTQVESLRGLSLILRPPILDKMGLDAAVRWLTRTVCDAHGIEGKVVIGGGWIRCSPDLELPLFRIIQEAVNNAVRHGHPRSIEISMDIADGWLRVSVHDDGQGFDNA